MLPAEVRLAYASQSPRNGFVNDFATIYAESQNKLTRWGCGISYHEFETALGTDIHRHVIADGYEKEIVRQWPVLWEDSHLRLAFQHYGLR
jgi:hypothetical protein